MGISLGGNFGGGDGVRGRGGGGGGLLSVLVKWMTCGG